MIEANTVAHKWLTVSPHHPKLQYYQYYGETNYINRRGYGCDPKYQVFSVETTDFLCSHGTPAKRLSGCARERLSVFKCPDLSHQGPQTTELGKQHLGPDASYFLAHF